MQYDSLKFIIFDPQIPFSILNHFSLFGAFDMSLSARENSRVWISWRSSIWFALLHVSMTSAPSGRWWKQTHQVSLGSPKTEQVNLVNSFNLVISFNSLTVPRSNGLIDEHQIYTKSIHHSVQRLMIINIHIVIVLLMSCIEACGSNGDLVKYGNLS